MLNQRDINHLRYAVSLAKPETDAAKFEVKFAIRALDQAQLDLDYAMASAVDKSAVDGFADECARFGSD